MRKRTCELCGNEFEQVTRTGRPRKFCYDCIEPLNWTQANRLLAVKRDIRESGCPLLKPVRPVELKQGTCRHCKRPKWSRGTGKSQYCGACKFGGPQRRCVTCGDQYRRPRVGIGGNAASYCVSCRRAQASRYKREGSTRRASSPNCRWCFTPISGARQWCSEECNKAHKMHWAHFKAPDRCHIPLCFGCGDMMPFRPNQFFCLKCVAANRNRAEARRRQVVQNGDSKISWVSVGQRDGWICHLCNRKTRRRSGSASHRNGAVVDHLVPIADGGEHTWSNVACAHWSCNQARGHRGTAQLRLVG